MNAILQQVQEHASNLPLPLQAELLHYALYLEQKVKESGSKASGVDRERLAQALEQAAALDPFRKIADPVCWQRGQREDRPLPGREHAD